MEDSLGLKKRDLQPPNPNFWKRPFSQLVQFVDFLFFFGGFLLAAL